MGTCERATVLDAAMKPASGLVRDTPSAEAPRAIVAAQVEAQSAQRSLARLVERGVLRHEKERFLWVFKSYRYR